MYLIIIVLLYFHYTLHSAITISPLNPKNDFFGWKNLSKICDGSGNKYLTCIEDELFYSKNHVFLNANVSFTVKSLYFDFYKGLVQFLEFGMIGYDRMSTVDISLNSNLSYEVFIMDPKIRILGGSPSTIPRSIITLTPVVNGWPTVTEIFLKVSM